MGFINKLMNIIRAPRRRKRKTVRIKTVIRAGCVVCRGRSCVDKYADNSYFCSLSQRRLDPLFSGPHTRSITHFFKKFQKFTLIEAYRCMPLLGNELENAPDWDVHIVRFCIIFDTQTLK